MEHPPSAQKTTEAAPVTIKNSCGQHREKPRALSVNFHMERNDSKSGTKQTEAGSTTNKRLGDGEA